MVQSPVSTTQHPSQQTARAPLSILRTETVLSRFPIHHLTTGGDVTIRITRTNAQGDVDLRWAVSYNDYYGPPRHLAYKLDTMVINQLLDTLPRPLPRVLKLGSLRQIGTLLDFQVSGRQQAHLKSAFHQNASAYIVAKLRYRGRDGTERRLEAGFTRYHVIFTGELLPDGTPADAVYLVLSEPYVEVLNHAPVRPLDYTYLKTLSPMAQRFYELLSYKMFAALKHRHPHATLRYAEYCLLSTQHRYAMFEQVKKQMYKVHRPHLQSHYLTKVQYEATTDAEGVPDWLMHYTPGPKAHAEYTAFMRQPRAEVATACAVALDDDQTALVGRVTPEPPEATSPFPPRASTPSVAVLTARDSTGDAAPGLEATPETTRPAMREDGAQARALVTAFYQRFHRLAVVTPHPKELVHAMELLATHGEAKAHFLLPFAYEAARATDYHPQTFGGILHYLPRALAAYAAQTTPATTPHAAAADHTQREQYAQWRQQALAQLRATRPPEELAALDAMQQARLVAAGTPAFALGLAVRVAVDEALEAQAGLPTFDVWRAAQGSVPADVGAVLPPAGGARHAS